MLAITIAGFLGFYLRQFKTIKQNHTKVLQNLEEQASTFLRSLPYKTTEEFLSDRLSPLIPNIRKQTQRRIWDYHIKNKKPMPQDELDELIKSDLKMSAIKEKTDELMKNVQLSEFTKRFEDYPPAFTKIKRKQYNDSVSDEKTYLIPSDLSNEEALELYNYEMYDYKPGHYMSDKIRNKLIFSFQNDMPQPTVEEFVKNCEIREHIGEINWLSTDMLIAEKESQLAVLKR